MEAAKKIQSDLAESRAAFGVLESSLQLRVVRPDQHAKAARILMRMETAGYSHEQVNDVVRALLAYNDDEMLPAFNLFAGADGVVDAEELKSTVPLLGEDMTDEQIRCLFKNADTDKSGKIESPEFCQMMTALTPKASSGGLLDCTTNLVEDQEGLEAALKAVDADPNSADAVTGLGKAYAKLVSAESDMKHFSQEKADASADYMTQAQKIVGSSYDSVEAVKVLAPPLYAKLYTPDHYARVGRIVERMRAYEKRTFTDEDINDVVASLFAGSNRDMARAYEMWAGVDGKIDAHEFLEVVPLLGED